MEATVQMKKSPHVPTIFAHNSLALVLMTRRDLADQEWPIVSEVAKVWIDPTLTSSRPSLTTLGYGHHGADGAQD